MGPRGLKINYNGIIRTVFDPKITFPTCVHALFFKLIFADFQTFPKTNIKHVKQNTKNTSNSQNKSF